MQSDRDLLKQALEALESCVSDWDWNGDGDEYMVDRFDEDKVEKALTALRERLAQPQRTHWEGCEEVHPECKKPETVMAEYKFQTYAAYKTPDGEMQIGVVPDDAPLTLNGVPLYPRREWVGLTDEEIKAMPQWFPSHDAAAVMPLIRAIESKLKEKNDR